MQTHCVPTLCEQMAAQPNICDGVRTSATEDLKLLKKMRALITARTLNLKHLTLGHSDWSTCLKTLRTIGGPEEGLTGTEHSQNHAERHPLY